MTTRLQLEDGSMAMPWQAREAGLLPEIEDEMAQAHAELMATCTCSGQHDDEADCPVSPPCTCGPHFDPYCPRDGDPVANLP